MIILKVIIIFHNYWKILKIIGLQKLTEFIYQRTLRAIKNNVISRNGPDCHCEERSDEAIHSRALGIALFYYRCQKEAFMIQTTDNVHRVAKISKVTKVQKIDYSYFSLKATSKELFLPTTGIIMQNCWKSGKQRDRRKKIVNGFWKIIVLMDSWISKTLF